MAYTTANGITETSAAEYHPGAAPASAARIDSVLRRAERLVRDLAPPSDPKPEGYAAMAADTELAVFEHLFERPSYLERDQLSDSNSVFADQRAVEELVRQSMGAYYVGPREIPPNPGPAGPKAKLTNVSQEPMW